MKSYSHFKPVQRLSILFLFLMISTFTGAQELFKELRGKVVDANTQDERQHVNVNLKNTNIATVTNEDGDFVLKVPDNNKDAVLTFTALGYKLKEIKVDVFENGTKILLTPKLTALSEISISAYKNAESLVKAVFAKTPQNNPEKVTLMTAFYRETIKKRKKNVSLTEAVVDLYKQPYNNGSRDIVSLRKARKSTDYKRLDTVAVKLIGGPFSTLFLDVMKYPQYIFTEITLTDYSFSFNEGTTINDNPVYVVDFKLKNNNYDLGYMGTLYIDVNSLALVRADYALDLSNMKRAKDFLVRRKPRDVNVYPIKAEYYVDYKLQGEKWYYSYGNVDLSFRVKKKGKLFNTVYTLSSEMAITDWEIASGNAKPVRPKDRLRANVIISDAVSGFSDPKFWGEYNLIEPEKSIESAIKKIEKRLKRLKS